MVAREVKVDVAHHAVLRRITVCGVEEPRRGVLEHLVDGGGHQIILGLEVGVEAAVSQPGLGHNPGHGDAVRTLGADGLGRLLQHPFAGLFLVLSVVAHGLRLRLYDAYNIKETAMARACRQRGCDDRCGGEFRGAVVRGAQDAGPAWRSADRAQVPDLRGDGVRPVHGPDRHPDRRRLAERRAGGAVGRAGRDQLGADRLSDGRTGDDPVLGVPGAGAFHPLAVRHLSRPVHRVERALRRGVGHPVDDRLSRHAGVRRRGDGADRVRRGVSTVQRQAAGDDSGHPRHGGGSGPDARPDGGRVPDRCGGLALDLLRQRRAGGRW